MVARSKKTSKTKPSNVIEVNFDDYEAPRNEYMGDEPRRGVYRFQLDSVNLHTKEENGNQTIHWTFECTDEPYKGWRGHMYTGLPGTESFQRTQDVVRAVQGGKEKGIKLDLDNPEKFIAAAKIVLGRVTSEEYNEEIRGRLNRVSPDDGTVKSTKPEPEDDEEDDDGFEDDEDEEEDDDAEDAEDDDDEEDDEDDEDDDEDDDEEEEEEPEPEPVKKKAKAKKAAPAKATTRTKRRTK